MSLLNQPIVLKMLAEQGKSADDFPVAKQIVERAFLIGCHPSLTIGQVEWIEKTTQDYFKSERKA